MILSVNGNSQTGRFKQNNSKFRDKFYNQTPRNEKLIRTGYHYVVTQVAKDDYKLRVFYPQTKQLLAIESYQKKSLKIKQGWAEYWYDEGEKRAEGNYKKGVKAGPWKHWGLATGVLASEGQYLNDDKYGEWNVYDQKGRLSEVCEYKYGFKNGPFTAYDSTGMVISKGVYLNDKIIEVTSLKTGGLLSDKHQKIEPHLKQCAGIQDVAQRKVCSDDGLIKYMNSKLEFPRAARKYDIGGKTYTQFIVNKDGSISDLKVILGYCDEFKNAIIDAINGVPEWEPGVQDGKAVRVLYTFPITFELE